MFNSLISLLLFISPTQSDIKSATVKTYNKVIDVNEKKEKYLLTQTGSGTIIRATTKSFYVLSCSHCFRHKDKYEGKVSILLDNGMEYQADLIRYDEERDLSLLRVNSNCPFLPAILAKSEVYVPGTRLLKSGFPIGGSHMFSNGECIPRFSSKVPSNIQILISDLYATHGDSGGGIYRTSDNCLIGVLYGSTEVGRVCVRLEDIIIFLNKEFP